MNSPTSSYDSSSPEPDETASVMDTPETASSPPPSSASTDPASGPPVRARRSAAAGWALLLSLAAILASGYAMWQIHEWRKQNDALREDLIKRQNDVEERQKNTETNVQQGLNGIQSRLTAVETRLDSSQGQADALKLLYQQFSQSQEDRIIAEVQEAVAIAGQQLRYAGNVETALVALRGAQTRLEQSGHKQFAEVQQALASDIGNLGQQGTLNIPETAKRLEHLLEKVDKLPLAHTGDPEPEAQTHTPGNTAEESEGAAMRVLRGIGRGIWAEIRTLVQIERLDDKSKLALLAPEQSGLLRENLKIRLLTARLAMLARDEHTYVTDLEQARHWIESFFDPHNPDRQIVLDELKALEAIRVGVKSYELSNSEAAVRNFLASRAHQTPQAIPPLPAQPQP
jgi:uroporphyrin-3 C-methyltransferase